MGRALDIGVWERVCDPFRPSRARLGSEVAPSEGRMPSGQPAGRRRYKDPKIGSVLFLQQALMRDNQHE